jgi:hypothetical protein
LAKVPPQFVKKDKGTKAPAKTEKVPPKKMPAKKTGCK